MSTLINALFFVCFSLGNLYYLFHYFTVFSWQNNQQVTEEIKREIKQFLETNDNENITTQNLWDVAKAVLRGKFIALQSYLKKQEKH